MNTGKKLSTKIVPMNESLFKKLALNKKLNLPGIGFFIIEQQPAQLDFTNKIITAPLPIIHFKSPNISDDEKNFLLADVAQKIKSKCADTGVSYLPAIGNIKKQFTTYSFEPDVFLPQYFPEIKIERIVRKDAQHTIRVGEDERTNTEMQKFLSEEKIVKSRWLLYAIILALLGIAALIYYNIIN